MAKIGIEKCNSNLSLHQILYILVPIGYLLMHQKITIHGTAFVTSLFRAGNAELSKDRYAHLWANSTVEDHANSYSAAVSKYEPYAHCLRNRYFYDKMVELIEKESVEVLINFGCGFSMYPFILDKDILFIEVDKEDVIAFKKDQISNWQKQGLLLPKNIHYLAADFNQTDHTSLLEVVQKLTGNKKSLILLEGVLFFLAAQDTYRLFNLFHALQKKGDYVGSVSFTPLLEKEAVFAKLINFVESNLEKNQQFQYQTVPDEFYQNLDGYELLEHRDTFSLSRQYRPAKVLPEPEVLNEHMYLLKKNADNY